MQLKEVSGIGEKTFTSLEKHGITTIDQLIHHFPRAYRTYRDTQVRSARLGDWIKLVGTITRPISKHGAHVTTQLSTFHDDSGALTLRWFNMPYLTRSIMEGSTYVVRGQLTIFGPTRQIVAPQISILGEGTLPTGDEMVPVYPAFGTLKSGTLRKIISSTLSSVPKYTDPLPLNIRLQNNLIDLDTSLRTIHSPRSSADLATAIRRLAFDELYDLQLESLEKSELNKVQSTPLVYDAAALHHWTTHLPYTPTSAQTRVMQEILADLLKPIAMHRLLAGEVGSGKTMVAAGSALAAFTAGYQTLVMAPTQILAEQLYASFSSLLSDKMSVSLVTGSAKGDLLANVVVGTQALLSPKSHFGQVGLVIVDEQHKFGVKQREYLASLTPHPHVLMMTATPIPRTLAMTIFSNMDISRLDELPKDRLPIKTYILGEEKRERAYAWIKSQIQDHHNQAFVVVPLIEEAEEDDTNAAKSLKLLEADLKKRFPDLVIDIMHGKMKDTEKTSHLQQFRDGFTQILVATSMVEVGIDIPSANIMVIEDAERFGLAQLHQLRGRVGRGSAQGHCLIFSKSNTDKIKSRLAFFAKESNGEKLAMFDLENRGPGELFGDAQHGFFSLHFASIYDTELLRETHEAAKIHFI